MFSSSTGRTPPSPLVSHLTKMPLFHRNEWISRRPRNCTASSTKSWALIITHTRKSPRLSSLIFASPRPPSLARRFFRMQQTSNRILSLFPDNNLGGHAFYITSLAANPTLHRQPRIFLDTVSRLYYRHLIFNGHDIHTTPLAMAPRILLQPQSLHYIYWPIHNITLLSATAPRLRLRLRLLCIIAEGRSHATTSTVTHT